MTPQKQLNRHDPENGVLGDCYRTAIACLLDLKPEDVPHVHEHNGALNMGEQASMMNEWLAGRGLVEITVAWNGQTSDGEDTLQSLLECMKVWNAGIHFMLTGFSRTGCNHVVICKDGEIVWDPSLTDAGIVGPADDGLYWVSYLGAKI